MIEEVEILEQEPQQQQPDPPSKKRVLYDAVSKKYNLGTYEEFEKKLKDPAKRKAFYDGVGKEYELGTYQEFGKKISEQPQELPPSNEIPTIEIETPDLFDLSKQYSELSNATKQVSEPTMAGGMTMGTTTTIKNVPDEEKRNQAKELSPVFEQEGIDPTDLYESTKTLTPTDYGYEGFTKPELLSDYKENKQLFDRKVARTQWKKGIDNALNEALINNNIDSDTYNYLQQSIESSLANSNVGDYKQQRQNINTVANIIKQFGGENKKEILDKYAVEVAKIYGNSDSFNFQKSYSESPESKYLTPSAALAYEYKKDIDPEGAKQFERVLIDPSKIKDEDEKRGYNHLMQTLEESGIGLRLNSVNEELNNLSRIAKRNGGLTPEQLELADKYEKRKQQLTVELNELDNKYPDRLVNKIDDAVQELMGQRQGYFNYAMGKTAQEIKNTGKGIWEALSTPFMSVEDNNMRELAIMGDKQVEDAVFHKVDKNKGLLTDKLVFSPELQTDIDAILNNKNLSDDKKKGDLYRLLADRKGEFGRVPIKGGKLNLNPASILYGVTDIAATLVPFVGLEAATGGIGGAGATARFLRTANAAFASSFHNEYAAAIQEGKAPSEAYKYAMGMNAISAAGMAGANTAEKVRMFFKGNTSASKIINSMTDDAIEQALKKTPKELSKFKSGVTSLVQGAKNRVKALPEQFKHGVKAGAEFEVAMTGARELQHQIYNNHIDREAGFKQSVLGMIAFPFLSMGIGQIKFRKPSELQKGSLLMVAEKPNDYIEQAKKMLDEGNLSKEQFEQVQTNIKVATLAYQKLSDANSGGSEMSEKSKAEFLANTALKIIGEKKAITEREKEQAAHRGLVLDYKNEFIRDEATSAELEKRLPQIEKELTPKKTADGKEEPINPKLEKQLLAEKDAINEYIEEKSAEVAAENARKLNERKSVTGQAIEPIQPNESATKEQGTKEPISESTETTGQRNAETTTPVLEQKQGSGIVEGEGLNPALQSIEATAKALEGVELKNEGKAEAPTKENVTERLNINNPFYKKVEDALVKLGLIEKYNPETGTGDVVGGYAQATSDGGISAGKMMFNKDGSISYFDGDVKVSFDKNGNVISENTKEVAAKNRENEIEGKKEAIANLEKTRDSENFKYKEVTETDPLGNRKKVKRLKTAQELKESTDKINAAIDKAKSELAVLEGKKAEPTYEQKVEATAKALEGADATFTADLSDSKLSVDERKQSAKKQIKDNSITNDASYQLISRALEKVDGLSVNNIFDLAKRIAKLDNKPILVEHIAEAIQYEVGRVEGEKDTFSLSIEDAKDVLLNWSKDAEPANKTRMDEIGIVGKSYRDRINKLKAAKKQYETLNEQGKALIKNFLNRFNDTILEDAKLNTDEYLQLLLNLTKSKDLVDVAENIQNAVRVIEDKEAIELQELPPVKEPLKNQENTEKALKRFSGQQLSEIPIYNRNAIVKMIDAQIKKAKQVLLHTIIPEAYDLPSKTTSIRLNEKGEVELLDKNKKKISGKKLTKEQFIDIALQIGNNQTRKDAYNISEAYHKAKADGSNPELVKAVEELLGKPTVIQPNAGKEAPKGQEPESIQMETVEGTPPKEPVAEASSVYIEPDRVIFSHRGLQEVATQFGLDDVTSRERKADIKLLKDADTTISEWVEKGEYNERVEEIVQRGKEGKPISDTENVIFAQHIANLKEQARQAREKNGISSKEYSDKVRELNDAVNVGTKMRSSAGATLRVSQMLARNYMESLDDAMAMKMEANKGADLTEKQKQVVEEQINEYKKRAEESEAALAEINAKFSEFQAEQNLKETQGTPRTKQVVKNGKRDFKAERLPLKERLKQEAAEFKAAGYKMGIASDGGGESFVISAKMAKTILEIGKNHLEELGEKIGYAAVKIKDVVDKTLVDVKESLGIDIKEQDIMDVLGGKYAKKRPTESEINAKMRELKSEASLLNEYKRLLEGGEPKSERKKIVRNQRLAALSKLIEDIKEEKGVGKYSDEAKAERLIKQNKKQQEEFERRLSEKDFDKKKKPESFIESPEFRQQNPELFNKVMDSINKKHEAQLEFEKGLFEEEWRNMQWTDQVKELGRKTFNTIKHLFASFDLSAIGVQNWPMIVNNPLIAYKAIKRSIGKDMFSQTEFDRFMTELHQSPDFKLMMDSGLRVNEPKSLLDSGREDYFPQRFKATITVNGKTYGYVKIKGNKYELFDLSKPFERQFTSLGNVLRVIKFRTEAEKLKRDGYTFEKNPEEFKTLATRINNLTSSADIPQAFQNKVTNIMIWSTRLMAAKLNMLGISDLVALFPNSPIEKGYYRSLGVKGKLLSKQQKAAAKDLAGLAINVVAGTYLYALARGGTVNWNPDSNQFLDVQYGDGKSINLSGGFSRYIGMMVQMARLGKRDKQGVFRNYRGTDPLKETANFIAQKAPPITRAGMNLIVGKDAVGEPTDIATEASKLAFPLAAGQVWEQIEKDGMTGLFSEGIPTLLGFNTKDNRDSPKRHVFDAPSLNFIQKHQIPIDYPDAEYTKGGEKIKMTEDEYKEYVKAYDKAIEEIISHIKEKGAEIIRNDEAQTVSYNDLKDDEIKEYIKDVLSYQMELYRSKTFDTKEVDEGEIQRKKDLNEDLKNLKNRPQF